MSRYDSDPRALINGLGWVCLVARTRTCDVSTFHFRVLPRSKQTGAERFMCCRWLRQSSLNHRFLLFFRSFPRTLLSTKTWHSSSLFHRLISCLLCVNYPITWYVYLIPKDRFSTVCLCCFACVTSVIFLSRVQSKWRSIPCTACSSAQLTARAPEPEVRVAETAKESMRMRSCRSTPVVHASSTVRQVRARRATSSLLQTHSILQTRRIQLVSHHLLLRHARSSGFLAYCCKIIQHLLLRYLKL